MGLGKERGRVVRSISGWHCLSYFGYGHGRAVRDHGERSVRDRSVCTELCPMAEECRHLHHARMDAKYPQVAEVVHRRINLCVRTQKPVVQGVAKVMESAAERNLEGVKDIKARLAAHGVEQMTDHYICGQFDNIQNGLDGLPPDHERLASMPKPEAEPVRGKPQQAVISDETSMMGESK